MSVADNGTREFGRWRTYFWPIHREELKKFLPMLLIFFLLTFDYNILRTMKDTLVVTAKGSGAEVIPFIKVWAMFPMSIFMTYLYTRLSNRFSHMTVVYTMFLLFMLFFALFAFVLYPARHLLHPHASADYFTQILPAGFKGLIAMYRYWIFTAFYVMAELWSNIVVFMLFWGFVNQITRIQEAKRFYGLFGIGINISGMVAAVAVAALHRDQLDLSLPFGSTGWDQTMTMLLGLVLLAGAATMAIFSWINRTVLKDPHSYDPSQAKKDKDVIGKLSVRDNISYLMRSKYLLSLAFIVIAYNLVINLVEVLWKDQMRELYPDPNDFNYYMNKVMGFTAFFATTFSWFVSGNSIRKFGWTITAMLTPIILLVTSVGFFGCILTQSAAHDLMQGLLGTTPLALAVFFGSSQNVLCRAAKYSVFDATKEMAFVPLSPESKIRGKAAIDGVAARLGKSSGSVVHQSLLLTLGSFAASAPWVGGLLLIVIALWMFAVRLMGRQFVELTSNQAQETAAPSAANRPVPAEGLTVRP